MFWRLLLQSFRRQKRAKLQTSAATSVGSEPVDLVATYFSKSLTYGDATFTTGVRSTNPLWRVEGRWPNEGAASTELLVGAELAKQLQVRPGDSVQVGGR